MEDLAVVHPTSAFFYLRDGAYQAKTIWILSDLSVEYMHSKIKDAFEILFHFLALKLLLLANPCHRQKDLAETK